METGGRATGEGRVALSGRAERAAGAARAPVGCGFMEIRDASPDDIDALLDL